MSKEDVIQDVFRIGMTSPLTGPAAESGLALSQGAGMAVDEINGTGGVELNGEPFEIRLFVADSESRPEAGVRAAEKLITHDKVHYLIGDALHSSVTMAIMDLADKYKIPIVSGESVSEAIVKKVLADPDRYRYYWKGNFGSAAYGHAACSLVEWLRERKVFQPRTKKVLFIVEDTDYGRSNAQATIKCLEEIGWSALPVEPFPLEHSDFGPQLSRLQESEADLLISIFTPVAEGAALVEQFEELGASALHIAIYYPGEPDFLELSEGTGDGLLWMPLDFDPAHNPVHKAFAGKVQQALGIEATYDLAFGYDALKNAIDSIRRAGSLDPERIVDAVALLDRQGIVGRYLFDPVTHEAKAGPEFIPVPVAQIQGGESRIVWPEQVATADCQPQPWME